MAANPSAPIPPEELDLPTSTPIVAPEAPAAPVNNPLIQQIPPSFAQQMQFGQPIAGLTTEAIPAAAAPMANPAAQPEMPVSQPMPTAPATPAPITSAPSTDFLSQQVGSVQRGAAAQKGAANSIAKAGEEHAIRDASYLSTLETQLQESEKQRQAQQLERQKAREEFAAQQSKTDAELAAAAPKDFWADKSTGAKIGAAIAIGLGAYAAGMNGGPNQALQIIQDAIKRDVDLQAAKRGAIKERAQNNQNIYQMKLQQFGDDEQARQAAQAQMLQLAKIRIDRSAAIAKSQEAKANAQALSGQIDMKLGEIYGNIAEKQADRHMKENQLKLQGREAYVPALGGFATSKEGAAKVNELAAATNQAKDGVQRLLQIADMPSKSISPEIRAEADTVARVAQAALRLPILGPGTVQENERKLLESIVADPTKVFSLDSVNKKRLQTLVTSLDRNLESTGKAYGIAGGPAQPAGNDFVAVIAKNGTKLAIPRSKVQDAIARGAKVLE